jgi:hypothetical protein
MYETGRACRFALICGLIYDFVAPSAAFMRLSRLKSNLVNSRLHSLIDSKAVCRNKVRAQIWMSQDSAFDLDVASSVALCNIRYAFQNEKNPWIRSLNSTNIRRFIRARSSNVYGHDWQFQTSDAGDAVVNGAIRMIRAHANWRNEIKIDSLIATMPDGDPILTNHMRWQESENGPVLFLDLDGLDETLIQRFLTQFALLCEIGQSKLRLGDGVSATVVLNLHHCSMQNLLTQRPDGKRSLLAALLWHIALDIALPNLLFMILQAANPVNQASHPEQVVS